VAAFGSNDMASLPGSDRQRNSAVRLCNGNDCKRQAIVGE
jgi:hypothetical protein